MIKHKAIKLFLILGMLLFSFFGVVGCSNEKVFEKKANNVISFPRKIIDNSTISAIPRFTINLNYDNANFVCKTYKGSFSDTEKIKDVASLNVIYYYPIYEFNNEKDYIDILICNDFGVFGYAVIEILYSENEKWEIDLIVSNFFVDGHGDTLNVTENYANSIIDSYHK